MKMKLALGFVFSVALGLRILAMHSDFWFDEIWSVRYAVEATSLKQVYAKALDNNHVLNSLMIHWIGPSGSFLPYRALAFVSGLVALALACFAVRPRSPLACVVRAVLVGGSPLLILLSTEARGYAPALAACLAGQWALRSALAGRDVRPTLLFNALLPLGLLSHLVFVHFYIASFVYALYRLQYENATLPNIAKRLAALFAFPAAAALAHGVFFVARMETGGGPSYSPIDFIVRLLTFTFGTPAWWPLLALLTPLGCFAFWLHLARLRRSEDPEWVFLLVITIVSPVFFLVAFPPSVIAVRYFSIQILFFLLAISGPIAAALPRGGIARIVAGFGLLAIVSGNAVHQFDFARDGRGHYLEAMRAIAASEPANRSITIGGDHDSRVRLLVEFYQRFIGRDIKYVRQDTIASRPPGWFIIHDTRPLRGHADRRISVYGHTFRHTSRYPFAYLSGFTWDVYRLETAATPERP